MGESERKKSPPKVGAEVPSSGSAKKGKRDAKDELDKQVSAKKQKNRKDIKLDDASTNSGQDKDYAKKGNGSSQENKGNPATGFNSSKYSDDDSDEDIASKSKQAPPGGQNGLDDTKRKVLSSQSSRDCCSKSGSDRHADEENLNAVSTAQNPDSRIVENDTSSDSMDDGNNNDNDGDHSFDDSKKLHMVKNPETPATLKEPKVVSKTICARNLSYSVERTDLEILFKDCGEIVDVRLHVDCEGRFKGYGHVEFATPEAAKKALELDNTELLRCPIKLSLAGEKRQYTPYSSNLSNSFQEDGRVQTVFVKGFDRSLTEEKTRASLIGHFSSCGEITRISIPTYSDSGAVKGFAHMDFKDVDSLKKALQLHKTKLGGHLLIVDRAMPRRDGGQQFGRRDGGHQDRWARRRSDGGWRH